jgi:hypothetical protein
VESQLHIVESKLRADLLRMKIAQMKRNEWTDRWGQ